MITEFNTSMSHSFQEIPIPNFQRVHNHGIGKHLQKPQTIALKRGISECLHAMMFYIWFLVQHICEFIQLVVPALQSSLEFG